MVGPAQLQRHRGSETWPTISAVCAGEAAEAKPHPASDADGGR